MVSRVSMSDKSMHIPDNLLPSGPLFVAHSVWFVLLVWAVRIAPWRQLYANRLHYLFVGATGVLLLLWRLEASITPGLGFHFLGVTVLTLMFGWSLGVICVSLVSVGTLLSGGSGWETLSLNALLIGILPVSVSYGIYRLVYCYLPHHVFIYIFLCGFFGSVIAASVTLLTLMMTLIASDTYLFSRIAEEYLPFLPLYLFPEGLLNGMLTTVFVGLRPEWLRTFDDKSYLSG